MITTASLAIVLLCLVVVHVAIRYNKSARLIDKIPGPTPIPFLGNLLMFHVSLEKLWKVFLKIQDDFYPIVRIWGVRLHNVFIRHPDDMKIILSCKKNINKSESVYGNYKADYGNNGLVFSGGEQWKQRRKLVNPAFNSNLLKVYTEIANEHSEQLIEDIKNQNLELIPDLMSMTMKLSIGIICEAAMGVDLKIFEAKKEEEFRHAFDDLTEIVYWRFTKPYIQDWMMKFQSIGRRRQRALNRIRDFSNTVIRERREYLKKVGFQKFQSIGDDGADKTPTNQRKRLALLDLLLSAEDDNLIDEQGVLDEVETFIVAGYDTTGIAITFALMHLAENKTIQALARKEATDLLNQTKGVLTIADINKLDYLDCCIKETLRLHPSVPFIARSITEPVKLSNYEIPQGTEVVLNFFLLHRDPNFWPDPEKFDPDRFLAENVKERHPFAYLPFSAGPRTCIGYKFAMLEAKAVVARILYNFYMEPVDSTADVTFKLHLTLNPRDPLRIKFIKINQESTISRKDSGQTF